MATRIRGADRLIFAHDGELSILVPARCGPGSGAFPAGCPGCGQRPARRGARIRTHARTESATPPAVDASEVPKTGEDPPAPAAGARQAARRRRAGRLRRHHRARHPAAAQRRLGRGMAGRRSGHRRRHRRQGPARQAPAGQHHQGAGGDAGASTSCRSQGRAGHRRTTPLPKAPGSASARAASTRSTTCCTAC